MKMRRFKRGGRRIFDFINKYKDISLIKLILQFIKDNNIVIDDEIEKALYIFFIKYYENNDDVYTDLFFINPFDNDENFFIKKYNDIKNITNINQELIIFLLAFKDETINKDINMIDYLMSLNQGKRKKIKNNLNKFKEKLNNLGEFPFNNKSQETIFREEISRIELEEQDERLKQEEEDRLIQEELSKGGYYKIKKVIKKYPINKKIKEWIN